MYCIIDTQILIWYLLDSKHLKKHIKQLISDMDNTVFVSQVSLYEIAIKQTIGKLPQLDIAITELERLILSSGLQLLPISNKHIQYYSSIPLHIIHRDPFDRLIIATVACEDMDIVSADENFKLYQSYIRLIEAL